MVMPRGAAPGLKPSRPGIAQSSRSTQRIVLPAGAANARINSTKPLSMAAPTGRINLPIGMILRCLPPEVLAADISEFEASGAAATEIGLPMNMILSQLPSGKVEMTLQDLVPHFPAGYLQPTESIGSYLPNLINLPLMDVVMRIPPDLLALRPDQKDVDAAVINMADPFTEEILREQAEAARRAAATQTNIIEESQAPQEEFVPRDQQAAKSPAPAQRPPSIALPTSRPPSVALPTNTVSAPPMPQVTKPSAPPVSGTVPRQTAPIPPGAPSTNARTISASGRLATAPTRATTAIPTRSTTPLPPRPQAPLTSPIQPSTAVQPPMSTAPLPPAPRQTASIPSPRPTTSMPPISRPAPVAPAAPVPPPAPVVTPEPTPEPPAAVAITPPDNSSADLQRLAALAMAEMGESEGAGTAVSLESPTEALPRHEASAVTQPVPRFTPPPAPEPEPEPVPEPVAVVEPEPEPFIEPPPEPEPEPAPVAVPPPAPVRFAAPPPPVPAPVPVSVAPVIPAPAPPVPESVMAVEAPKSLKETQPTSISTATGPVPLPSGSVAFNLNTCTADDLVQNIPGCFPELAASIVQHRNAIGSFKRLEDLLDVPGMTKAAYTNLTGEAPPDNRILLSLSELLGFPSEQHITLKDVTDRISCWPDVTGCVLSQSTGLSLVGSVPDGLDKAAIVAFAPRMFDALNKSFAEITGTETDALLIPTPGNSFHIFRNKDLYLIILSRLPQMPERHMKVARFVLSALSVRRD